MSGAIDLSGIYSLINSVKSLSSEAAWSFALSKKEIQEEIIRLNQEQLMEYGITSEGRDVMNLETGSSTYAPFTVKKKQKRGQRYDHITLHDEGRFYASFRVEYGDDWFQVLADDKSYYDRPLFEIYGENVMGLTKFNLDRITPLIRAYYAKYAIETLQIH